MRSTAVGCVLVVLLSIVALLPSADAKQIRCYQCDTTGRYGMSTNCRDPPLGDYCWEGVACVKITNGAYEAKGCLADGQGIQHSAPTQCSYDAIGQYVCTCNSNKCNGSMGVAVSSGVLLLSLFFFFAARVMS
ncbi:hypothetical protein M3Y99_01341900 [Aphelenchoides fujianensis]|nr:hypothetical protein M3Y99_01341900 [Aphelenchoides fujianensis]